VVYERTEAHDRFIRISRVALRVIGIVVAALAIFVGTLIVVLKTSWGGERIRRQVVSIANMQIQGRLGIGRLSFGGDRLVVWDVTLRDPEGQLVAQIARAEVDVRIGRLLHKEVRVTALVIESPELSLVTDAKGMNLTRATAQREQTAERPQPARPRTQQEGWVIALDRFELGNGDVRLVSASSSSRRDMIHFTHLRSGISARYATGNGSTDLAFGLNGQSVLAPSGPLAIKAEARVRGDAAHVAVAGQLLGGTVEARADIDRGRLEATDALVALAIPRTKLFGFDWGPLRVDGRAHPGMIPKVDALLSIPGVELTAKGDGPSIFKLDARLAVNDLSLTARALQALTDASEALALAGHGQINVTLQGPLPGGPSGANARFDGEADLHVALASIVAGATKLGAIRLDAGLRHQELSAELALAAPEPISLSLAARLDDDRQGLKLSRFELLYPRVHWISEGDARVRFADRALTLDKFRLRSDKQTLALDASKVEDRVEGHLALSQLRLDLLPAPLVDPALKLGGAVDLDVAASGDLDNPKLTARLRLTQGRFQRVSRLSASLDATVADHGINGTLALSAPFALVDSQFQAPVDPLAGGPLDVTLNVTRLDLADALLAAALAPRVDGRLSAHLRVSGEAASPKADLTVIGRDLDVKRPAGASVGAKTIEFGHARIRLTYEKSVARADIDFGSAQGGTLRVNATARIDLGYPRVTQGIVAKKIPVHGKVVAKDFDVAWIAQFNPRVETLGGQVSADAQLAGTLADPQFVGDVRWKNGKMVATAPSPPARTATAGH